MGKKPMQATLEATAEIGFTIVSMTLSLVAVFIPFLFMGGILGSLFKEFAVTISIAILVSGFVSLTLTPMMGARMLRSKEQQRTGRFYRVTERGFDASVGLYDRALGWVLRHKRLTMVFSAGILAATVALFVLIPKGFLPTEDTDQLNVTTEAIEGISYEGLVEAQREVTEIIRKHPDVAAGMANVGARGGRGGTNQGRSFIRLKARGERERSATEVAADLAQRLSSVQGMRAFVTVPPPIRLGGRVTKSEYQLTLQGTDTDLLFQQAPRLAQELSRSPILSDVTTDVQLKNPEIQLGIDRDRAAQLGVSVARIEDALYSAYGSRQVSTIYTSNNSYDVILELDPRTQRDPGALRLLHVRSDSGALVPLSSLADVREAVGPLSVSHTGQLPSATVSFNLRPGHSLSEAVAVAEATALRVLPAGITASFQGSAQAFQDSLQGLGLLLFVSIFVIYLVLGILYESLLDRDFAALE
jgi:HAE1 family hydrophobic/amphiphilic exporter-1